MSSENRLPRTDAKYGTFRYPPNDQYIGKSLELYGEWCEAEVSLFKQLVRAGDTVIDAGANIGSYTVPLSQIVGNAGTVYAFEPQAFLASILSHNIIENECNNVRVLTVALGNHTGSVNLPDFDYFAEYNFGGISFENKVDVKSTHKSINVPMVTLDDVLSLNNLKLLKLDVENMELPCLQGAQKIMEKHKPFIYLEYDRKEHSEQIVSFLEKLGYSCYMHQSRLFRKDNFKQNSENVFGRTVCINLLCAPSNVNIKGLKQVSFQ